jgi:hypothetical protein
MALSNRGFTVHQRVVLFRQYPMRSTAPSTGPIRASLGSLTSLSVSPISLICPCVRCIACTLYATPYSLRLYRDGPRHSEAPTKANFPPPVRIFMAVAAKCA